jgi:hypothetical protein
MNQLLVIGAGATIEECRRSGNHPDDPDWEFPVVANFCSKLFDQTSTVLMQATAAYLSSLRISYETKLLNLKVGDSFSGEDIRRGPIGVFLQLEAQSPGEHNIERLAEHVWQTIGADKTFWSAFIHDGIYLSLFARFSQQFGLGLGRQMVAGRRVALSVAPEDAVINLNYDLAFDLALKQAGRSICYGPETRPGTVMVLKPHGSFNLYVNVSNGNCFFEEPDRIAGSVGIPGPDGGVFFAQEGIVPPRLHKSYRQHPSAEIILATGRPFSPTTVTFWGVGLTDSDVDLLAVYREATAAATLVEFVNPSAAAVQNAERLLGVQIQHFESLDSWFTQRGF